MAIRSGRALWILGVVGACVEVTACGDDDSSGGEPRVDASDSAAAGSSPTDGSSGGSNAGGGGAGRSEAGISAGGSAAGAGAGGISAGGAGGMDATTNTNDAAAGAPPDGSVGEDAAPGSGGGSGSGGSDSGPNCGPTVGCQNGDGCCVPVCTSLNDSDCTNVCGNGTMEEWEPCDDNNTVTESCAYGLSSCYVCSSTCTRNQGATSYCGDFFVDGTNGETCDRNCPTRCSDLDACTTDAVSGSGCEVVCGHNAVTACTNGDGCCPAGCPGDADCGCTPIGLEVPDDGIDNDCAGGDATASDQNGIFVAKSGIDTNPGTQAAPKLTVASGLAAAAAAGEVVYVAAGVYSESVEARVSIFGGYTAPAWTRDIAQNATEIRATTSAPAISVRSTALGPVLLDGLRLTVQANVWSCDALQVNGQGVAVSVTRSVIDGGSCSNTRGLTVSGGAVLRVANSVVTSGTGSNARDAVTVEPSGSRLEVIHSTIYVEDAFSPFGGITVERETELFLLNSIVTGAPGSISGAPIVVNSTAEARLFGNDIWAPIFNCLVAGAPCGAATPTELNGCTFPGCAAAASNVSSDPNLQGSGFFTLGSPSPCRDAAADPGLRGFPTPSDFEGTLRPTGAAWDVGHDERAP